MARLTRPGVRPPARGKAHPATQRVPAPGPASSYGRGERLPADVEKQAQFFFSHDFSGVRVHADETAARTSRLHNARAFAVGSHVVFGADQYRPHTPDGRRLLVHELAHVVQQASGGPVPDLRPGNALDAAADRAASGFPGPAESVGASGVGVARAPLQSVDVTKLSDAELQARAFSLGTWFDDHLPDDPEYETRFSLAKDVFVEMQTRAGSPTTPADVEAFKGRLLERSPRTAFERRIRRGELPQFHPVYDKGKVVGYRRESGGYYEIVDIEGRIVWTDEKPLETPLIDPIDLIPFELVASLAVKATMIGVRAAAKLTVRVVAKEAGTVVVEEGVKLGS
ncbi:MAG TPA: DUF4157 domain-containing protein, partial [Actinomycetota bacterium]